MSFWQPMASIVTTAPSRSRSLSSSGIAVISETIATLPGPIRGSLGREQGESTWDPLNASELAPNSANGLFPSLIAWAESQPAGNVATVSDFIGFRLGCHLAQGQVVLHRPSADHVQGRLTDAAPSRTALGLPVDGDGLQYGLIDGD